MINFKEVKTKQVNLQTWSHQYNKPPAKLVTDSHPKVSIEPLLSPNGTLQIPPPKIEVPPKIPKGPLHRNVSSSKAALTYNIVDDLVQSLISMSMLEFLQTCQSQWKVLLFSLGIMDPSDDHMISSMLIKWNIPPYLHMFSFKYQSP